MFACLCTVHILCPWRRKRASDLLDLELQVVLSYMWMLGTKCGFFARSVNALNL